MSEHLSIERMNELVDGLLPTAEADAARAHVDGCAVCREELAVLSETVASLRALPRAAGTPAHLWAGIEARIEGRPAGSGAEASSHATVLAFPGAAPGGGATAASGRRYSFRQLAAAALVAGLLSAGAVWTALQGPDGAAEPGTAGPVANAPALPELPGPTPGAAARAASVGTDGYDQAVLELEALVARGRSVMAPETLETLEASVAAIDAALADVRRALDDDPSSELLMSMLVSHQTAKLRVLRQAATQIQSRS